MSHLYEFADTITGKIARTTEGKLNIFYLEKFLLPSYEWINHKEKLPANIWQIIENHLTDIDLYGGGSVGPMGLGYKDDVGYFILFSGQGPGVGWMEKPQPVDGPYPYDGTPFNFGEIKPEKRYMSDFEIRNMDGQYE